MHASTINMFKNKKKIKIKVIPVFKFTNVAIKRNKTNTDY